MNKAGWWGGVVAGAAVVSLFLGFPWVVDRVHEALPYSSRKLSLNELGDMYGPLSALFTGLGFVGLLVTIWMQRDEMRRSEIRFREELKKNEFSHVSSLMNEFLRMYREERAASDLIPGEQDAEFSSFRSVLIARASDVERLLDYSIRLPNEEEEGLVAGLSSIASRLKKNYEGLALIPQQWQFYLQIHDSLSEKDKKIWMAIFWNLLSPDDRMALTAYYAVRNQNMPDGSDSPAGDVFCKLFPQVIGPDKMVFLKQYLQDPCKPK